MRKILSLISIFSAVACATEEKPVVPGIVPTPVVEKQIVKVMPNNIIGAVERVYLPPMKSAFMSRIDTGATTASLDADKVKNFERDGKSWISFTVINRDTGESHTFEKPVIKRLTIRRIGDNEQRPVVQMDVKMGAERFKANFTVAEREKFDYQLLIGRNILNGRAIVDVSISNTLK